MNKKKGFDVNGREIGSKRPAYFIADIGANHDGSLERALKLIDLAAEAGADAVNFQHFSAATIVSDFGFSRMGSQQAHQSKWKKSVFEVYEEASVDLSWTKMLKEASDKAGVAFFTSPYSFDMVDHIDDFVPAHKVGSGDITWTGILEHIAKKGKPVFVAAGASTMHEVNRALDTLEANNTDVCLMQCNTNYSGSDENFDYINLNVLKVFEENYPSIVLGLSDHTSGHATVLGAVALGAKVIEKHFTDDCKRSGPDHGFAMDPVSWRDMVDRTRELERAMGRGLKEVEKNEKETVIVQRRAIRMKSSKSKGSLLTAEDVEVLRPCPSDALEPWQLDLVLGKALTRDLVSGEHLTLDAIE